MQFIDLKAQYARIAPQIHTAMEKVLAHGQYIMGPEITTLEATLSEYVGAAEGIAVGSGSDALLVALMALDIQPGDEIITTPFSFMASTSMLTLLGAKPVFIDIEPATYNLDANLLEAAITPNTKAILAVDLYGQCADYASIVEIAERHHVPVIEDAAQSFGATQKGQRACSFGTIACTSFFPAKPLGGYGEGGMCFTNDSKLAEKMRQIRHHGQAGRYEHVMQGLNARMDTLQAAVLLEKFKIFEDELANRQRVADYYDTHLKYSMMPIVKPDNTPAWAQYTVQVANREQVMSALRERGIPIAVHYPKPLHQQAMFAGCYDNLPLPHAEYAGEHVFSLPMHPYLTNAELKIVCDAVNDVCEKEVIA